MKVGLTGGYASGKSFVAAELDRLGCYIIYADKLGHQVLLPDGEAYAPVVETFGADILDEHGFIHRKKLGRLVFSSPEKLAILNKYVHPAVFRLEDRMLRDFAAGHPHGIAVVEAAILIETGRYVEFDRLVLTACSEELQIARAMARDHAQEEQVRARMQMQMPLAEKRAFASYVVETGGSLLETKAQVKEIFDQLRAEA